MKSGPQNPLPMSATDRWRQWAEKLATGHLRTAQRRCRATQILAERPPLVLQCMQQQTAHSWHLRPQLKLSISAFLYEMTRLSPGMVVARTLLPERAHAEQRRESRLLTVPPSSRQVVVRATSAQQDVAGLSSLASLPLRPQPVLSPLQQVVRRSSQPNWVHPVYVTLAVRALDRVIHRMIEQKQRVEVKSRTKALPPPSPEHSRAAAAPPFAAVAQVIPRRKAIARPTAEPSAGRQPALVEMIDPHWSFPQSAPAINVEQLTEQVLRRLDDRIVAHRERLGKPGW